MGGAARAAVRAGCGGARAGGGAGRRGGAVDGDPRLNAQRHLVTVWNPSYTTGDAAEDHLRILLGAAREHRGGAREAEDIYVWWGKVRSRNRREGQPLTHEAEIRAIAEELDGPGGLDREVHLYVTDYRSLYVGHIVEIVYDDIRTTEPELVPAYYTERRLDCDCWFRLADVRRLVDDNLLDVIEVLQELRVVHYDDRPVSLYGGMRDLPLVVTRADGARVFDGRTREQYTGGKLWAEFDADRGGSGAMQAELRDNVLGEAAWGALHPEARAFVAAAERLFRQHRGDAGFNFGPVVLDLAKALEVHCNDVVRRALATSPRQARLANVGGATRDVVAEGPLTLGQLAHALRGEPQLQQALRFNLQHGDYFNVGVAAVIGELAPLRNSAAHGGRIDRATARAWRDRLLGVGCRGELTDLARVRVVERAAGARASPAVGRD